jgi:hypothetical protein
MGNVISLDDNFERVSIWPGGVAALHISNGLTSVLLSVLVLSGSDQAATNQEKEFIVWLAEHDQQVFGLGMVSFSVAAMPWTVAGFTAEKAFLLATIDGALVQRGWERLPYRPFRDSVDATLYTLRGWVEAFAEDQVDESAYLKWRGMEPRYEESWNYPRCPRHGVLLHWAGCIICNDMGPE